ncbi:MAG: hypothetical protein HY979_02065 [Candidatus Magasanikbacteria bacterium]|nr:hypothetical protein [Candidatus Magasanikbacteria bacterium]
MTNKVSRIIAIFVALVSMVVMVGWFLDFPTLKNILPQFVTMKFITAVCFLLSSLNLYLIVRMNLCRQEWESMALLFVSFLTILLMASLLVSTFIGIKTGVEDLFVKEVSGAVKTVAPGRPSLVTMINFVLIAGIGLSNLYRLSVAVSRTLGLLVTLFGGMAILGYIIDLPKLYGHFNNFSTAMALHTAILFVLLGVGFLTIRVKKDQG